MGIITLTTDFGARDWFVGTMKGVILGLNPRATVVDITHEVPPGDIRAGAFALRAACRYFPKGTIHVAVVDPGVGSRRDAVAAWTSDYRFVGPDNGVLSWALTRERVRTVHLLKEERFFRKPVSRTFHGRDVFAPVAAHLSRGLPMHRLGPELSDWIRLPWPQPTPRRGEVRGEIMHLDRFGNAITNIESGLVSSVRAGVCVVMVMGRRRVQCPLARFYGAVPANRPLAVIGSSGLLEIAINGGSAAAQLGLSPGRTVVVRTAFISRRSAPAKPVHP